MNAYECKECGKPVIVTPSGMHRSCKHTGTVLATMAGTVTGVAKVENAPKRT